MNLIDGGNPCHNILDQFSLITLSRLVCLFMYFVYLSSYISIYRSIVVISVLLMEGDGNWGVGGRGEGVGNIRDVG